MSRFGRIRGFLSRRQNLRIGLAATAFGIPVAVALLVLAAQPTSSGPPKSGAPMREDVVTSAPSATVNPYPPGEPVPAGFTPESVSFVAAERGWVLGSITCGSATCPLIAHTDNGGRAWTTSPAPPLPVEPGDYNGFSSLDQIRFADERTGWVFNLVAPDEIWSTHDGGASWRAVRLPGRLAGSRVMALAASGSTAWLAVGSGDGIELLSSPIDADRWTTAPLRLPYVATQWQPGVQLVLADDAGWLVETATYQTDSGGPAVGAVAAGARLRDGQWSNWTPPCTTQPGGGVSLAATSSADLVATCGWVDHPDNARQQQPDAQHLLVSHDGGVTFADVGTVSTGSDEATGVVAAGPRDLVVDVHNALLTSTDTGQHWVPTFTGWISELSFPDTGRGVAIHWIADTSETHYISQLIVTDDGGATWTPLPFAS